MSFCRSPQVLEQGKSILFKISARQLAQVLHRVPMVVNNQYINTKTHLSLRHRNMLHMLHMLYIYAASRPNRVYFPLPPACCYQSVMLVAPCKDVATGKEQLPLVGSAKINLAPLTDHVSRSLTHSPSLTDSHADHRVHAAFVSCA